MEFPTLTVYQPRISRKEAKAYIETYFRTLPWHQGLYGGVVREARDKGYVETLFRNRRRFRYQLSQLQCSRLCERTAISLTDPGSASRPLEKLP